MPLDTRMMSAQHFESVDFTIAIPIRWFSTFIHLFSLIIKCNNISAPISYHETQSCNQKLRRLAETLWLLLKTRNKRFKANGESFGFECSTRSLGRCFKQEFAFLQLRSRIKTTKLTLNGREIEHIYLISFLTNLTELNLSNNNISDISNISKLKNLRILDLNSNSIEDISALQSLLNLTHLSLVYNKLTSYTLALPLALPNLLKLKLGYNKLQDKSGLQHSPKLQRLHLNKTETSDLLTIPHQLFGQKVLNLQQISYLSNFVDLQYLDLSCNQQLQNIEPLKFCTQLTQLFIFTTSVSDIWPLQFMINLKALSMAYTKVVDLHPLQYLYKLDQIYSKNACIIDVSPLAKLTLLESVEFRFNKITNAETLKHHKNFSEYDFSDQKVLKPDELMFYNKILSVHSFHKQIRKIQVENRVSKFRESMTRQKEFINLKIYEQIHAVNQKIEIWAQFIQNSNADQ
ncbi:leucine-rich_repeat domain-containing protein [Hexamita inflata]|uniref:Leucine-rich repeat domain-containing protein n=1 Tax=Hexamita inflata TaxID=28002 RepID=A0AA86UTG7_9EUKA|nr:leucine-rich repeat domain-containing protein [Hexamita inflata]